MKTENKPFSTRDTQRPGTDEKYQEKNTASQQHSGTKSSAQSVVERLFCDKSKY